MSMQSFSCIGVTNGGRLVLKGATSFLESAPDGVEWNVEIKEAKKKRSLKQNATLWGPTYDQILAAVMKEQGYRPDEILQPREKNQLKQGIHYGLLAKRFGHAIDPLTKEQVPARTSSELNVAEMCEYFEWLVTYLADEHHIVIELPDEFRKRTAKNGEAA